MKHIRASQPAAPIPDPAHESHQEEEQWQPISASTP